MSANVIYEAIVSFYTDHDGNEYGHDQVSTDSALFSSRRLAELYVCESIVEWCEDTTGKKIEVLIRERDTENRPVEDVLYDQDTLIEVLEDLFEPEFARHDPRVEYSIREMDVDDNVSPEMSARMQTELEKKTS